MNTVAVFARPPVAGAVKTRLSPALPGDLALTLYRGMLADALAAATAAAVGTVVLYWAAEPPAGSEADVPSGVLTRAQRGADLGERLAAAFAELLPAAGDRAVAIGADCPDLTPAGIREAFDALADRDVALGPARDGGYYLIGLRRPVPGLFHDVPWGTGGVLAATLARAREAGLTVSELPALDDLDTPADLVAFAARRCVATPGPAPRTEAALRAMGLLPER